MGTYFEVDFVDAKKEKTILFMLQKNPKKMERPEYVAAKKFKQQFIEIWGSDEWKSVPVNYQPY